MLLHGQKVNIKNGVKKMSREIVEEEEYTVEVSGTFHVFAESQEQANEYIEEQLYRNSGYVEQLSVYSPDYEEQD